MTTPLFLLRCVQLGLSMGDLDFLTIGLVNDMFTERENDDFCEECAMIAKEMEGMVIGHE